MLKSKLTIQNLVVNLFLSVLSVIFFWLIFLNSGRISVNEGLGYDGTYYANMLIENLHSGTANTQLRPLLILLTRIPYYFNHNIIDSFIIMNCLYVFLQCLFSCLIFDFYNKKSITKIFFVVNISLCIATAKIFAFYPTLIDLGAHAVISLALYLILIDRKVLAGIACLLAVLTREFSLAVIIFGISRNIRLGSFNRNTVLTYSPSLIAFILLRIWVKLTNTMSGAEGTEMVSLSKLISHAAYYGLEPVFITFFCYFALTIFGGISITLWSQPRLGIKYLQEESEYSIFLILIVGISALGNIDIWRYLAYSLPVVTMLFARYFSKIQFQQQLPILLVSVFGTLLTQQPFASMNIDKYFGYWFPLYWFYQADGIMQLGINRLANFELIWISLFVIAFVTLWLLSHLHRQIQQKMIVNN